MTKSANPPTLDFQRDFDPAYGRTVDVAENVRRITAPNRSAYTFAGTNSYLLGGDSVAIIDPGPLDEGHLRSIAEAVETTGYPSHIILTHHHPDHLDGAARLKQLLGVPLFGTNQCLADGAPVDVLLYDGDEITGSDWALEVIHTPGHTADHLCFGLKNSALLFSGDHVMGWSTSVIIPPDGNLSAYLESLEAIATRGEFQRYLPGHGGIVEQGPKFARALRRHRLMRSAQILSALEGEGALSRDALLDRLYPEISANLRGAAAQSLRAHILDLIARGDVEEVNGTLQLQR